MQDSLLSRFDLIFIVLDEMDPDHDRRIADHVLRMHRFRNPGEKDGEPMTLGGGEEMLTTNAGGEGAHEQEDTPVYDKHDHMLHGDDHRLVRGKGTHRLVRGKGTHRLMRGKGYPQVGEREGYP